MTERWAAHAFIQHFKAVTDGEDQRTDLRGPSVYKGEWGPLRQGDRWDTTYCGESPVGGFLVTSFLDIMGIYTLFHHKHRNSWTSLSDIRP